MRKAAAAAILALAMAGCDKSEANKVAPATRDLGTGLNTVDRPYPRSPEDLVSPVRRALEALDLKVSSEKFDHLGGEMVAHRATGQKVTATIRSLDVGRSSLSIRVEPGDRNLANVIHDKIGQEASLAPEKTRQP